MKRAYLFSLFFFPFLGLQAQVAPVPTSWDCETGLPTGWTSNMASGSEFYISSTCDFTVPNPRSFKLDFTGRFLQIEVGAQPGPVAYEIGGQTGSAPYWNGTFVVQESVNGASWNTIKTYTGAQAIPDQSDNQICMQDTAFPTDPNARFIRFFFQDKQSGNSSSGGGNVKLDNISVLQPPFTSQKLELTQGSDVMFNNGNSNPVGTAVGSPASFNLGMANIALAGGLNIDSVVLSGPNSGDFNITGPALPTNIAPGNSLTLQMTFTPAAAGSREALMTIYSNDHTVDSVFTLRLYGIGGNLASDPTFAVSNLSITNLKTFRYHLNMNLPQQGPDAYGGYLILRSEGQAISAQPVDGQTYQRGMTIGNAKVIYVGRPSGNSLSFIPNWIMANTNYEFAVYSYNGLGTFTNYAATAVTASTTTPQTMLDPTYYSGVSETNSSFVGDLHNVVNPHTAIFYSDYIETMVSGFQIRDTFVVSGQIINDRVLDCPYSGAPILFQEPYQFGSTGTSREHTFSHSWMPTFNASSPERPEYSDQHNLYPVFQNINEIRCNYPFGEVETPILQSGLGTLGLNALGNRVFEPTEGHKGRVARALMYMTICYNSVNGNGWNLNAPIGENCNGNPINYPQDQQLLLDWHFNHPPNNFDVARNDFLDSLQGNRNPFVDNPDWPCYIDFTTMTWIANPTIPCATVGLDAQNPLQAKVWPIPAHQVLNWSIPGNGSSFQLSATDIAGREVMRTELQGTEGQLDLGSWSTGMYILRIEKDGLESTFKVLHP